MEGIYVFRPSFKMDVGDGMCTGDILEWDYYRMPWGRQVAGLSNSHLSGLSRIYYLEIRNPEDLHCMCLWRPWQSKSFAKIFIG